MNILIDTLYRATIVAFITLMFALVVPLPNDRGWWLETYMPQRVETVVDVVVQEETAPVRWNPPIIEVDPKEVYVKAIHEVYGRRFSKDLMDHVYRLARRYKMEPELVIGLIAAESSFRPEARSVVGAVGYAQVWPKWHQDKIRGRNIMNPWVNLEVGVRYLRECIDNRGDLYGGLACYNGAQTKAQADRYFTRVQARRHELALKALEIAGI